MRRFPILGSSESVPWAMVAACAGRIAYNHDNQTLERLAERGGLSAEELLAAALDQREAYGLGAVHSRVLLLLVQRLAAPYERKDTMPRPDFDNIFSYHAPTGDQPAKYERIRAKARELAELIADDCPDTRERSLAQTNIEQAVFWANASIARHG
jgi:hypothetical protein